MSPNWDLDLKHGRGGERYVWQMLHLAEGSARVEVKSPRFPDHYLYVEYEQRPTGRGWRPSGIATTEADYWVFLKPNGAALWTPTPIIRSQMHFGRRKDGGFDGDNPTRGMLLDARRLLSAQAVADDLA